MLIPGFRLSLANASSAGMTPELSIDLIDTASEGGFRNRRHFSDAAGFGWRTKVVDDALNNLTCIIGRAKV